MSADKMTLHKALTTIRTASSTRINERYMTVLQHFDGTDINAKLQTLYDEVDARFDRRMKNIFDSLAFDDQIQIAIIHPEVFYKMLDAGQQIAWKLLT